MTTPTPAAKMRQFTVQVQTTMVREVVVRAPSATVAREYASGGLNAPAGAMSDFSDPDIIKVTTRIIESGD